ncbi:MAG: serine/threonine protein phosphatase [Butyrivibrio sp.]|nr:serine/threonine protein phosphatase [Butyrivibrio sp.]
MHSETIKCAIPLFIYSIIYLKWFAYIESTKQLHYTVIHTNLDDKIPFLEIFIIPYLFWFVYVSFSVLYFLIKKDKEAYFKLTAFLVTGMTLFLLISTFLPNIQYLRPIVMPRDNIFTHLVQMIYSSDTPTNLWPSIHCYNSIGTAIAISKSDRFSKKSKIVSTVFAISIILSTMFVKQHSVFDVVTAFLFSFIFYIVFYKTDIIVNAIKKSEDKHAGAVN